MRSWRNWQTRKTKDLVANTMQVQFLSTAPNKRFIEWIFNKSLYFILERIIILLISWFWAELASFLACWTTGKVRIKQREVLGEKKIKKSRFTGIILRSGSYRLCSQKSKTTFCVSGDQEIAFETCVFQFTGAKPEEKKNKKGWFTKRWRIYTEYQEISRSTRAYKGNVLRADWQNHRRRIAERDRKRTNDRYCL